MENIIENNLSDIHLTIPFSKKDNQRTPFEFSLESYMEMYDGNRKLNMTR